MRYQLSVLTEISLIENIVLYLKPNYLGRNLKKALYNPLFVIRKLKSGLRLRHQHTKNKSHGFPLRRLSSSLNQALRLEPGEKVRVKSLVEIEQTLDEKGKFDRLYFMRTAMGKHCGGIYSVKKRINLFFDERSGKLQKLRNVIILDGVYCEKPLDSGEKSAG